MNGSGTQVLDVRPEQVQAGQLPLFGTDLEIPTYSEHVSRAGVLGGTGARAGKNDPTTSHLAASSITPEGLHASQQWVLAELRTLGVATAPQLIRNSPRNPRTDLPIWSESRIRTAILELIDLSLAVHLDDEGISIRGRACARYQAVAK